VYDDYNYFFIRKGFTRNIPSTVAFIAAKYLNLSPCITAAAMLGAQGAIFGSRSFVLHDNEFVANALTGMLISALPTAATYITTAIKSDLLTQALTLVITNALTGYCLKHLYSEAELEKFKTNGAHALRESGQ
jgi:hypothetical protein